MVDSVTNSHYITEHWKDEIKEVLDDALIMRQEIQWWDGDFPNGDFLNVPTASQLTTRDYVEGSTIETETTTSTNYQLAINKYKQAGIQITDKFREDSAYIDNLVKVYQVEIVRALMRQLESDIANLQAQQTASNPNTIDGVDHRWVSPATNNVGGTEDFHLALYALSESNSMTANANAYISPIFVYQLQQISNLISQDVYGSNVLLKEGGLMGKMITAAQETRAVVGNIAGFTVYNHTVLDRFISETVTASAAPHVTGTVSAGKANMFMGRDALVGAMRTRPSIDEFRDHKVKSDVLHATFRYGVDLYRPESLCVALTDPS